MKPVHRSRPRRFLLGLTALILAALPAAVAALAPESPSSAPAAPTLSTPARDHAATRVALQRLRERLELMRKAGAKSSDAAVNKAQAQLERLAEQFEAAAKAKTETGPERAGQAASALAERARRLQARIDLIEAAAKGSRALEFAVKTDFARATALVGELAQILDGARATLAGIPAYAEDLNGLIARLREAQTAAGARASDAAVQLERALSMANEVIDQLASDETRAASEAP